jgi:hypothetical protein
MADTYLCGHCGSTNLMTRMIDFQCLSCGNRTDMDGFALPKEPTFHGGPTAYERRPA